jgi:tRNA(fMet)-specific endonuclease VapC
VSRYCLDTSAYSQFKRGAPEVTGLIDRAEWVGIPSIVIGELFVGFFAGGQRARNEEELSDFLANPVVDEIPVDREVAWIYADIVTALRRAGIPLPTNDIWIAATSARVGAPILTFDEHFEAIGRVGTILLKTPPASERTGFGRDA